jgi:hypothetical protein
MVNYRQKKNPRVLFRAKTILHIPHSVKHPGACEV